MKKFIVSVFLLGWLPLYAAGSSLQETEEVAVANEMSEAGSVVQIVSMFHCKKKRSASHFVKNKKE